MKNVVTETPARQSDLIWLKERVVACGMSQADLAERIESHPSNLTRLFHAQGETSLPKLLKIADLLGVSLEELLRRLGYTLPEGDKVRMLGHVLADGFVRLAKTPAFVSSVHVSDVTAAVTFETGAGMDQAVMYFRRPALAETCINSTCLIEDSNGLRVRVIRWATSRDVGKYSLHPVPGTDAPIEDEIPLRSVQKAQWLRY